MTVRILNGDCRDVLKSLPDDSVHCCITSPPYWGLREYDIPDVVWGGATECEHQWGDPERSAHANSVPGPNGRGGKNGYGARNETKWTGPFCQRCGAWRGQFGLEPTYQLYVEHAVEVFREVRRVLRDDGTLWLNLGDSYATGAGAVGDRPGGGPQGDAWAGYPGTRGYRGQHLARQSGKAAPRIEAMGPMTQPNRMPQPGLKPKDLCGVPWRVAFALQADGWWLRQDVIWSKPNPMPESVTDRCTKAHEYLFLLSKSKRYYFNAKAIQEPVTAEEHWRNSDSPSFSAVPGAAPHRGLHKRSGNKERKPGLARGIPNAPDDGTSNGAVASGVPWEGSTRNKRSVWTVTTLPFADAHFATFPPPLIEPCILAGSIERGTILDPFGGSGTTGVVADRLKRDAILIDLGYHEMAERRIRGDAGMFADIESAPKPLPNPPFATIGATETPASD